MSHLKRCSIIHTSILQLIKQDSNIYLPKHSKQNVFLSSNRLFLHSHIRTCPMLKNALDLPKENLMNPHTLPRRGLEDRSQMWWLHCRTSDCRSEMGKGYPLHKLDPLLTWCSCLHVDMWIRSQSLGWTRRVPQLELFIDKEEYHIPGPCALQVSYPATLDDLSPLHWDLCIDPISNIQRTQKYSAVKY